MWDRRAQLVRVKDGDTIVALLDQGFRETLEVDVRLLGVWAPESDQPGGPETAKFVADWFSSLPAAKWPFIVTTARMKYADKEQMTFDRYVGLVTAPDGSRCLNVDVMLYVQQQGYGGGTGSPTG